MRLTHVPPLAALLAIAFLAASACSQQGEGEICDPRAANAGNSDCQSNLVCTPPGELSVGTQGYRCCPADRTNATGVCAFGQSTVPADSAAPDSSGSSDMDAEGGEAGDAGASDGGTSDGATDDATDGATADGASVDGSGGATDGASADGADGTTADGAIADATTE